MAQSYQLFVNRRVSAFKNIASRPARDVAEWCTRVRTGAWALLVITLVLIPIRDGVAVCAAVMSYPSLLEPMHYVTVLILALAIPAGLALTDCGKRLRGATRVAFAQVVVQRIFVVFLFLELCLVLLSRVSIEVANIRRIPFLLSTVDSIILVSVFGYTRIIAKRLHLEKEVRWTKGDESNY
mgnify:CR=1 FL=1